MVAGVDIRKVYRLLLATILFSATFAENEDTVVTCAKNLFDVKLNDLLKYQNNELSMNIYLDVTAKDPATLPEENLNKKAEECLDEIRVSLKSSNSKELHNQTKKFGKSDKLTQIKLTIDDLEPVSAYYLQVSYVQKNTKDGVEQVTVKSEKVHSCFGSPSKPRDLKKTKNADGSVTITWKDPEEMNSPHICHYDIFLRKKKRLGFDSKPIEQISEKELSEHSYTLSKENAEASEVVRVVVYTDEKCMDLKGCETKFNSDDIKLADPTTTPPTTIPATNPTTPPSTTSISAETTTTGNHSGSTSMNVLLVATSLLCSLALLRL